MSFLKTPESRHRLALWLLWFTPAMWSVNYIVARTAPGVVQPHVLALGRWGLAGLVLGLAYIFFFNAKGNPFGFLYGTMGILVINSLTHFYTVSTAFY